VKRKPRQLSAARIRAPNISFRTGFSPKALGTIFSRRPSLAEQTLDQIRRAGRATMGNRQAQVRDTGFEVVVEAPHGSRQAVGIISYDAGLSRNCGAENLTDPSAVFSRPVR
jgi:hypothetical protein